MMMMMVMMVMMMMMMWTRCDRVASTSLEAIYVTRHVIYKKLTWLPLPTVEVHHLLLQRPKSWPAATATQIVTQELVPLKSATEGRALIGWCTISKSQGLKCERHRQHVKDPDIAHDWNILKLIQTQMLQIYLFGTARVLKPRVLSPKGALSDATSFQAGTQRLSTFQSIERAFRHSATNRST